MMHALVSTGPLGVGITVPRSFEDYKSGVYIEDTRPAAEAEATPYKPFEPTGHAVLVVGYGVDNGIKYWRVKNSALSILAPPHPPQPVWTGTKAQKLATDSSDRWTLLGWGRHFGETGYFRVRRGTDEIAIESMAVTADVHV